MLDDFLRDLANNFDVDEALPSEALLQLLLAKEMLLLEIMVAGVEIHVLSCKEYLDDADVELDHECGVVDLLPPLGQQGAVLVVQFLNGLQLRLHDFLAPLT